MCPGRFEALQSLGDDPLLHCPHCGLPCKRVVSRAAIKLRGELNYEKAAKKGLTTWKRTGEGKWEKVAGEGVDAIVGSEEDLKTVREEKASSQVFDLSEDPES